MQELHVKVLQLSCVVTNFAAECLCPELTMHVTGFIGLVSLDGMECAQLLLGKTNGGAPTVSNGVTSKFDSSVIMEKVATRNTVAGRGS